MPGLLEQLLGRRVVLVVGVVVQLGLRLPVAAQSDQRCLRDQKHKNLVRLSPLEW